MTFHYLHLLGATNNWQRLAQGLRNASVPAWREAGYTLWGCWQGLFGVASNELIVMLVAEGDQTGAEPATSALPEGTQVVEQRALLPTARPTHAEACSREGLYVFRRFAIDAADIDTVANLSAEAWKTFEDADTYATQPLGLFAPAAQGAERCEMLLVTWYDGFESWSTSRAPAPEARANFQMRRDLTHSTVAAATRLLDLETL